MVKSEIKLRYSGFIVFASKLLSVATGIAFVLMITRTVSEVEFGIWGNINDVFSYFILLAGVLPFWTTRFVAREHFGSAKTGLVGNIFISIASASIYLALLPLILSALQIGTAYAILYAIISIQILELYTVSVLEAVLLAKQPQTIGYGLLAYEVCKVTLGFILIIQLKLGLLGAIYSMISSHVIQIIFYMRLTAKELKESVNWTYLKEWLKASPINLYSIVGNRIAAFPLIFLRRSLFNVPGICSVPKTAFRKQHQRRIDLAQNGLNVRCSNDHGSHGPVRLLPNDTRGGLPRSNTYSPPLGNKCFMLKPITSIQHSCSGNRRT